MAKKKARAKAAKYKDFKLYGKYPLQTLLVYVLLDLAVSALIGLYLQGQILQVLASQ